MLSIETHLQKVAEPTAKFKSQQGIPFLTSWPPDASPRTSRGASLDGGTSRLTSGHMTPPHRQAAGLLQALELASRVRDVINSSPPSNRDSVRFLFPIGDHLPPLDPFGIPLYD